MRKKNKIKAVIFDMDGLMIDSELTRAESFKTIIRKHGADVKDKIPHVIGVRVLDNWKIMKKKYNLKETPEKLMEEGEKEYTRIIKKNVPDAMPGLFKLIDFIKKRKIKRAVVSSSSIIHIKIKLQKLGLADYFKIIVSGDMLTKGKPDPEGYLLAAKKLQLVPEECLVLEDAETGVKAAKNANMNVVAVPNEYTKNQNFSKADKVVNSLEDINLSLLSSL